MKLHERLLCSVLIAAAMLISPSLSAQETVDHSTYNTALVRLAESGDLWAQYCLGEIYEFGKGTPINFEQMARWYIAAANHPEAYYHAACYAAGWCYEWGNGVPTNMAEAIKWYRIGADDGNFACMLALGRISYHGKGIAQDYNEAFRWFSKCFEYGDCDDPEAQNYMGVCYEKGYGTQKNPAEALKYYTLAANNNDQYAQYNLAMMYYDGRGVAQNRTKAFQLFKQSADQGHNAAMFYLFLCYENGHGTAKNHTEANKWLQRSADAGYDNAKRVISDRKEAEEKRRQQQRQQQQQQQQQQRQQQQQPKSTLFYSGPYTQTGKSINNMGQYNDTGAPSLHQVKIYNDKIVVNSKEIALWKQHGDWYYYGQNEGEPIYLFNPKAFDLRWRFVFNFGGKQISDNFWVPGDQMALHTFGGYGRYPDSTRSTSVPAGRHRCGRCDGAGDYPTDDGIPHFGRNDNQYCTKCGTVKPRHWHKPCESCKGQGWW